MQMPSLQHTIATWVVPRLRRNMPVDDLPAMRAALVAANRAADEAPPAPVRRGHEEQIENVHGFPVFTSGRRRGRPGPTSRGAVWSTCTVAPTCAPTDPRHCLFAVALADAIGARAVLPAYPLAPEFTVDDSFDEMVLLVEEVAAAVARRRRAGRRLGRWWLRAGDRRRRCATAEVRSPTGWCCIAPWVDLTGTTPGTPEAARRDPWLSFPHLSVYASFWAGSDDPEPCSPTRGSAPGAADLAGLPPALMFCGTRDLLQPGCDALFERAEAADWPLEYVVAPDLIHVYPLLPIPEARGAFEHIVAFCARDV